MKPFRMSIAASLGVIAIAAVGLMGMRVGKPIWASITFCLTLAFLLGATLKATIGPAPTRPGPIGFAVFGWVYLATVFGPWGKLDIPPMPHAWLVGAMLENVHPHPIDEQSVNETWQSTATFSLVQVNNGPPPKLKPGAVPWSGDANSFRQSAHAMAALAFAVIGTVCGRFVARRTAAEAHRGSP
jgi:hypothetical protein